MGEKRSYDALPGELTKSILTKLRPRDLLISMAVSKSWRSIIRDPSFSHVHREHSRQAASVADREAVLIVKSTSDLACFPFRRQPYPGFDRPCFVRFDDAYYLVTNSCDGLVLLRPLHGRTSILWNPAIRRVKLVPPPEDPLPSPRELVVGLGCMEDNDQYDCKIIEIYYFHHAKYPAAEFTDENTCVMVYSSSTHSRRRIRATPPAYARTQPASVYLNGSVHWQAKSRRTGWVIMGFDMREEVFWEAPIPKPVDDDQYASMSWSPAVCQGSLSVIMHRRSEAGVVCGGFQSLEIWVMQEYRVADSWSRLFFVDPAKYLIPVGCMRNGKFMAESRFEKMVVYKSDEAALHPAGLTTYLETLDLFDDSQSAYKEPDFEELQAHPGPCGHGCKC